MGGGSFTRRDFASYSTRSGKTYDSSSNRVVNQIYTARTADLSMIPHPDTIRECCNTEEHPNTIPVILALDVTGSMGASCAECAEALGNIMSDLYEKYKDIQIMVMGIGDFAYDRYPCQVSQFESDVRIAKWMDKIYMERGGGGNGHESYSAAWYFGLNHCKLDCWNQGRKGIIITMGDESLNPYLPCDKYFIKEPVNSVNLYKEAINKFDIFHIAVDDKDNCYCTYKNRIESSFGSLLNDRLKIATVDTLSKTICECINNAVSKTSEGINNAVSKTSEGNFEISW